MALLLGIDLGTSSLKAVLMTEEGTIVSQFGQDYSIEIPSAGFAEQNPDTWWEACVCVIKQCLSSVKAEDITAIGFSGQMHGAVPLNANNEVVRNAILHCDQRSTKQVTQIAQTLGQDYIVNNILNPIFPGFQLASLAWMRDEELALFEEIKTVLSPKDYLRFRLTGILSTEQSDASATLAYDILKEQWNKDMLSKLGLPYEIFPECLSSTHIVGAISKEAAAATGLCEGTPVSAGGSDQVMQSIGNGVSQVGEATATIGTSGQVFFPTDSPTINPNLNTHTFCGVSKGNWYTMGAMLSAGVSLKWLKGLLAVECSYAEVDRLAEPEQIGSGGLIFLPYLSGERTPHLNPDARGSFIGLTLGKNEGSLLRSVMEGIAFAMKQCMDTCTDLGLAPKKLIASGGAVRSKLWLQIQSDVYGMPLHLNAVEEHAAVGAAIVAGVACGTYGSVQEACKIVVKPKGEIIEPNMRNHKIYMEYYELFKELYIANASSFKKLSDLERRY